MLHKLLKNILLIFQITLMFVISNTIIYGMEGEIQNLSRISLSDYRFIQKNKLGFVNIPASWNKYGNNLQPILRYFGVLCTKLIKTVTPDASTMQNLVTLTESFAQFPVNAAKILFYVAKVMLTLPQRDIKFEAERGFTNIMKYIFDVAINGLIMSVENSGLANALNNFLAEKFLKKFLNSITKMVQKGGEIYRALKESTKEAEDLINDFIKVTSIELDKAVDRVGETIYSKFKKSIFVTFLCITSVIVAWYSFKLMYNEMERKLKQPRIIIESSFKSPFQKFKDFIFKKPINFRPMVFPQDLETRLVNIIEATMSINFKIKSGKTNVKYRNLFLFGAPGTGKTMFAKELAKRTGMDYAMITGSSFFQEGAGVREMDELFRWAHNSKKGFILIIDEADSFLIERSKLEPNSKSYQLLNHFLNYTGERNSKFMIVFCANHKNNLDSAMRRRVDDYIEIPLPNEDDRYKVLWLYREQILFDEKQNGLEFVQEAKICLNDNKLLEIAQKTDGLSNADLEGIINNIKTDGDITSTGFINNEIIDRAVDQAVSKYKALLIALPATEIN